MSDYEGAHFLRSSGRLMGAVETAAIDIANFKASHDLPDELFTQPDHIALKYADAESYRDALRHAQDYSTRQTEIEMQGRYLATVDLRRPIQCGVFGALALVEVMQRKRGSIDPVGVDHIEFSGDDSALETAQKVLQERGVAFKSQQNSSHEWVSLELPSGLEVKFNSLSLERVIDHELATGQSRVIWQDPS